MSGFRIVLATLPQGASRVELEADPAVLGLEPGAWQAPVSGDLLVEMQGDRVSVRGKLEVVARLECVRCLREFPLPLSIPFEVFAERAGSASRIEEEELDRDDYMRFHDGRELDVREDAKDALLLEIPIAPHCREDCLGLCPSCGADRNEGPCSCSRSA